MTKNYKVTMTGEYWHYTKEDAVVFHVDAEDCFDAIDKAKDICIAWLENNALNYEDDWVEDDGWDRILVHYDDENNEEECPIDELWRVDAEEVEEEDEE